MIPGITARTIITVITDTMDITTAMAGMMTTGMAEAAITGALPGLPILATGTVTSPPAAV